jgi:thymidine kinase
MEYECKICIKKYSSYQSIWIHNKKFHSKVVIQCNTIITDKNTKVILYEIKCNFCNRIFNTPVIY